MSPTPGRSVWQVGSLSHAINAEATGYLPQPDYPQEAPDPTVRDVEDSNAFWGRRPGSGTSNKKTEEEGSDFYSSISGSEESGSETESETGGVCVCVCVFVYIVHVAINFMICLHVHVVMCLYMYLSIFFLRVLHVCMHIHVHVHV